MNRSTQRRRVVWCGAAVLAGALSVGWAGNEVPFVSTPNYVVDRMLKLADVRPDDVVYDLGCGDGRICIAASQVYGCRSVGIDIDPVRIDEANNYARRAGVSDKTKFILKDVFDSKFDDATVVCLYMLGEFNMKLRPRLLSELKPGTRIVAHTFGMGDWKPEATEHLGGVKHDIFLWIVPARVDGRWDCTLKTRDGEVPATLNLRQKFQEVSGTVAVNGRTYELQRPTLVGDVLSFEVPGKAGKAVQRFSLKMNATTQPTEVEEAVATQPAPSH